MWLATPDHVTIDTKRSTSLLPGEDGLKADYAIFAQQKSRMGLFVRTIGIGRARTKIAFGQSRLQSHPLRVASGANCTRMKAEAAETVRRHAEIGTPSQLKQRPEPRLAP